MRIGLILLLCLCFVGLSYADADSDFVRILDEIQADEFETAWASIESFNRLYPDTPEYSVLVLNYYFMKAQSSEVEIMPGLPAPDEPGVIIKDSLGNEVGYLKERSWIDTDTLKYGIDLFMGGLRQYPDRLDMHMGLVFVAAEAELYGLMTDALLVTMGRTLFNKHTWLWAKSQPLEEEPVGFVLENVQTRISNLFRLETEYADSLLLVLSHKMIQTFPHSAYGYSNIGSYYGVNEMYDSSTVYFEQAYDIDSSDVIVIMNLANMFESSDNIPSALKYYKRLELVGNEDDQEFAKAKILELTE